MRWWVRDIDHGDKIHGPYDDQDAALGCIERVGGTIISERIFEPQFVASEEVEAVISKLRAEKKKADETDCEGNDYVHSSLRITSRICQEAIDALVLLSAKKRITGQIEGGILSLDDLPAGIEVEINDYDIEGVLTSNLTTDENGRECSTLTWG